VPDESLEQAYERNVGHPPRNLPDDHPDRWQWEYRGTKAEREGLLERLGLPVEEELPPAVIDGQEELFT
jgi:hypothetical protein